eukprot:1618256-Pyramimonas_sp.AAC.1
MREQPGNKLAVVIGMRTVRVEVVDDGAPLRRCERGRSARPISMETQRADGLVDVVATGLERGQDL